MSDIKSLLKTRATIKSRKPTFRRQDAHKKNEIKSTGWRRPRGLHSKMRENRRGYRRKISIGWKSPALVRGLHPTGLLPVLVHNVEDLARIDSTTQGAIIGSSVGGRKRMAILTAAKGKLTILNIKDVEKTLAGLTASLADRKKAAKARDERKQKVQKETAKPLDKKVEDAPKTKEEEKKEQDKVLTHRDV